PFRFWLLSALCAIVPDADVLAFAFHIPYGHMLGHRGLTHSLFFAVVVGFVVSALAFRDVRPPLRRTTLGIYLAAAIASHALLDALTDGGRGVALFAPFSARRYFFPWRPIEVSPIGAGFFSERGWTVLASEFVWVWLPSGALILAVWLWRFVRSR
ncbi:MAG TPA: metal-dependent hydrolase, partial [Pyrinomonadaceae bacterium]|nr:metal-dependent hydrolase [Pyrinomonadaceae bacterium]